VTALLQRWKTPVKPRVLLPIVILSGTLGYLTTGPAFLPVMLVLGGLGLALTWSRPMWSFSVLALFPLALGAAPTDRLAVRVGAAVLVLLALIRLRVQVNATGSARSALVPACWAAFAVQVVGAIRPAESGYSQAVLAAVCLSALGFLLGTAVHGRIVSSNSSRFGPIVFVSLVFVSVTALPSQLEALGQVTRSSVYIPRGSGLLDTPGGPNILGSLLVALQLLGMGVIPRNRGAHRWMYGCAGLVSSLAIFLSYSRRAWCGLLVGGAYFLTHAVTMRRRQVVFVVLAAAAVVGVLTTSTVISADLRERFDTIDYGVTARTSEYEHLADLPLSQWAVGEGPGSSITFDPTSGVNAALHSSYLVLVVDYGLLGFLPFALAIALAVRQSVRDREQVHCVAAGACIIALAIASLFGEMIVYGVLGPLMWFAIGILAASKGTRSAGSSFDDVHVQAIR
jgi:hypothetical protein